ncbi:MAG TPA: L,D-transpeptidase family protein [Bacillota bacterium]|nr:L,D-transpeptidase family protein [Bacillota bacterium]
MERNRWPITIILILTGVILIFSSLLALREERHLSHDLNMTAAHTGDEAHGDLKEAEEYEPLENPGEVTAVEERILKPSFPVSLSYDKYLTSYTYLFVEKKTVDIRSGPSFSDPVLRKASFGERLDYLESVYIASEGGIDEQWIHAVFEEKGEKCFGFVNSLDVIERRFQFDKMEEAIKRAEDYAEKGRLTYISNYQNRNGSAPLCNGKVFDRQGNGRSQSAPGYYSLQNEADFLYLGDGTLVCSLLTDGDNVKVEVVATGEKYYVPIKYIPQNHEIHELARVIAVDVTNQNEAVFEKISGEWTLISYTQATTGVEGRYSMPTPTGFFFAMESRPYFRYYEDGTTRIQGYAPYAIRFAGGAYIHGIPVNYKYGENGELITPPHREYSAAIGTVPLSHKCVRNYTSHAKFLYNWFTPGETIVVVID